MKDEKGTEVLRRGISPLSNSYGSSELLSMAQRDFRDDAGHLWTVWTVHPTARELTSGRPVLSEELKDGWLAFRSDAERRRLAPIRNDLNELSDSELLALLEQATPRAAPRRLVE